MDKIEFIKELAKLDYNEIFYITTTAILYKQDPNTPIEELSKIQKSNLSDLSDVMGINPINLIANPNLIEDYLKGSTK